MGVADAPGDWHGQIGGGPAPFADRPLFGVNKNILVVQDTIKVQVQDLAA